MSVADAVNVDLYNAYVSLCFDVIVVAWVVLLVCVSELFVLVLCCGITFLNDKSVHTCDKFDQTGCG